MTPELVTLLGFVLNFLFAWLIGKGAGPKIKKGLPILNLMIGVLTQVGAAATHATSGLPLAAPAVAMAGFFGTFGKGFLDIVLNGIIQGLLTTGLHSSQKNLRQIGETPAA